MKESIGKLQKVTGIVQEAYVMNKVHNEKIKKQENKNIPMRLKLAALENRDHCVDIRFCVVVSNDIMGFLIDWLSSLFQSPCKLNGL